MSGPDIPHRAIASLSPRELEVLHLLATGHTAKSIAQRLGRSETSINERLRDARRKTGVGSSRELARIVHAQENRDKKIDLSTIGPVADLDHEPPASGARWSKGTTMMIGTAALVAAGLAAMSPAAFTGSAVTGGAAAVADARSPLLGTWSLDTSRIPADERPRSVTLSFSATASGEWQGKVEIVGPDGSVQNAVSSATLDGPPVPLSGNMKFADTVALRQPSPGTLVMTFEKGGVPVSTRVYTVEGDGNMMKETIVWAGEANPRMVTTYFKRVS